MKNSGQPGDDGGSESSLNEMKTGETDDRRIHDEHMFRNILAACPVGLCRVEDRKFKWVNDAMAHMFGYDKREFVGKSTRLIYASDEDYEGAGAILYERAHGRTELEADAKLIRKDGLVFDGHVRISASDPANLTRGTIVAITDRTPIRKAEAAIAESERRFREILENVRLVAVCMDLGGAITFCNDFLLEMTGWVREEILGKNWFDVFACPKEENQKGRWWYEPLAYGDPRRSREGYFVTRTGDQRCIRWNTTVFLRDPHNYLVGVASVGEDITERKQANALLLHTERIKAVGEMAGAVAHNFNNLLQMIMGSAHIAGSRLDEGDISGAQADLSQVLKVCELGALTVKRLQEFTRGKNGHKTSDHKVFDLTQAVQQAVQMSKPWWEMDPEKEGIAISLETDLGPSCLVNGKENELFEVAINLIKNAAEACPEGGNIRVRTFAHNDRVVFQVQDNGIGISEANLGKVFQPFWTTKGFRGTGMGLSSCYGIVSRHGGAVAVDSSEGKGATFTITLPRIANEVNAPDLGVSGRPDFELQLLLVDDMEDLLRTMEDALAALGQKVFTAKSGHEAVSIFRETAVDAVICDLGMEGMNGWEVSRTLQSICLQEGIPKPPFILLTGWGGRIAQESAAQSGVDRVVAKPVSILALLEALGEIIRNNKQTVLSSVSN
jgi:PAS domain S-box-containing protein